jgi:hypothetical protein
MVAICTVKGGTNVAQTSKSVSQLLICQLHDYARSADLEIGDTAGLETCATPLSVLI